MQGVILAGSGDQEGLLLEAFIIHLPHHIMQDNPPLAPCHAWVTGPSSLFTWGIAEGQKSWFHPNKTSYSGFCAWASASSADRRPTLLLPLSSSWTVQTAWTVDEGVLTVGGQQGTARPGCCRDRRGLVSGHLPAAHPSDCPTLGSLPASFQHCISGHCAPQEAGEGQIVKVQGSENDLI